MLNFYQINSKCTFTGSIRYGLSHYDFDSGGLSFIAPNHLMASDGYEDECEGTTLLIHRDFLKGYPLAGIIKQYGFFSYAAREGLQLSDKNAILFYPYSTIFETSCRNSSTALVKK